MQPRSVAFATSTGLAPPARCVVCFAIAFIRPLQPAPAFGAAKAGIADAAMIAAIRADTIRIERIRLKRFSFVVGGLILVARFSLQ
jgi:hypothetical protein